MSRSRQQISTQSKAPAKSHRRRKKKYWSAEVKTASTFPPEGTFTKSAPQVARILASKKVSPKGIGSGLRMLQFFINRAGKNLSAQRRAELEKAKALLREKLAKQRKRTKSRQSRKQAARA